jgi:hypothetical protein
VKGRGKGGRSGVEVVEEVVEVVKIKKEKIPRRQSYCEGTSDVKGNSNSFLKR